MLQYSYVCSSMMSVRPNGRGSARDTRVSLASVDMVSGLVKCCWMSLFPMICGDSLKMVTALFSVIVVAEPPKRLGPGALVFVAKQLGPKSARTGSSSSEASIKATLF